MENENIKNTKFKKNKLNILKKILIFFSIIVLAFLGLLFIKGKVVHLETGLNYQEASIINNMKIIE
ncbi:MAG: hypothetical protein KAI16_00385 [Candidatus Pacebacteria bacterium]|nr:hypothetical protein [Candidatus Paceibacterota bacterium]